MSVFDQFNANPYIKMYAGAPIDAALEVGKVMQGRHDKALTDMQQHEYALNNIQGIGAADKEYKNRYAAELSAEFEKLAEAPEMAGQAINSLAAKYKQDPTLRAMQANATAMQEWEAAYAKDPSKYGDVAAYEMQQAVQQYNADGGAVSASFKAPPLKELKDMNKFIRENAALIKSSSNGEIAFDPARGLIHTSSGEAVSFERAQNVLNAALMGDPQMREQLQRQFKYEKGQRGYEGGFDDFVGQSTQGVAEAVSFFKQKVDAKGYNPYPNRGKSASGADAYLFGAGANNVVDKGEIKIKDLAKERKARNPSNYQDTQLTQAEDREYQGSVDAWAADNQTKGHAASFFRQVGIDGLPTLEATTEVTNPGNAFSTSYAKEFNAGASSAGYSWDMSAVEQYAKDNNLNETQEAQLLRDVKYGMNGVFGDNLTDNMNELRKDAYQTTWTPIESYGLPAETKDALGAVVFKDLTSSGSLVATINGEEVEMTQGEFDKLYEGADVTMFETNGSGQVEVKAKKRGTNEYDTVSYVMPVGTSSTRKYIGAKEVELANSSQGRTRSMHIKNALAIGAPTLVQQGHVFEAGIYNGDAIGLDFGDAQALIVQDFGGQPELSKNSNGDFIFTINNQNVFENNEKMTTLLSRNGLTGAEAVAGINDYITRQYAQGN